MRIPPLCPLPLTHRFFHFPHFIPKLLRYYRLVRILYYDPIAFVFYISLMIFIGKAEELVKAELKRATAAVPRIQEVEELKSALLAFVHSASADSLEYKKRLLATFVERVTVSNAEIVIYFKFPIPGNGDTFKCDLRNFADKVQNVLNYYIH